MSLPRELFEQFEPFEWGTRDCVHFAEAARRHFGGSAVPLPTYTTEHEAVRTIAAAGGLRAMLVAALGEPVPLLQAQIGDTVLTRFRDTGDVVGVADPPGFWLLAPGGFVPLTLELALAVWPCRR